MDEQYMKQGVFSWCELMTSDVGAAKEFYAKLFGWTLEDMHVEGMNYTVIQAGGHPVGGMMPTPPGASGSPPMWGCYVSVDDVDATACRAGELGGTVCVAPMDIPGVGRFCVLRDPQGAVISAITYLRA